MKETVVDRGESVGLMEPLLVSETARQVSKLSDFAVDLAAKAAGLRRSLPGGVAGSLANLVRAMNCYYSNLIEGHDTHPVEIERALRDDYSTDPKKRNLQLEARAHIAVQTWIDDGGVDGMALTAAGLRQIHRRFCDRVPSRLIGLTDPRTGEEIRINPGEFRTRDVQVGRHVPVSPGAIPRFLSRFESAYANLGVCAVEMIVARKWRIEARFSRF